MNIIINEVENVRVNNVAIPMVKMCDASIVIIRDKHHFRCVKNRWANTYEYENIPLMFLRDYLRQFEDYLTAKDVFDSWIES